MNEDTRFSRCKAGRVTPDKFEKGNTWQAGRRITIIKSLQLSGEIFFSITHLLKKRSEDDIIVICCKICISNFYRTGLITALPCVSLDQTSCEGGVSETL